MGTKSVTGTKRVSFGEPDVSSARGPPPFESARRWWVNSGCDALVVMVESTKVANLYDTTATLGMHLPLLGAVHREGLMNPVTMDDMSL